MSERAGENNWVSLTGEIVSVPFYSHRTKWERFYMCDIAIRRLSGQLDIVPLVLSERLIHEGEVCVGRSVTLTGQFRSYNKCGKLRHGLFLSVFVNEICFLEQGMEYDGINDIYLKGYICKVPTYRHTPLGREITDLFIAVNRPYGRADYIPCIAWGRNARWTSELIVSDHICLSGRIQSRKYIKVINDSEYLSRTAYEVSIGSVSLL